ncbi:MAG TPA: glutamine synthetase [Caulobacteraceae bacterium]|nr:glutamine synthetase [Caulobacteraceae bacterium]
MTTAPAGMNANDLRALVDSGDFRTFKVGVFDIDGVLRGKYMAREKLWQAIGDGFGFCDVVLGWDSQDKLYDNVQYTGWHTGYPDAKVRLLPPTARSIPFEDGALLVLGEFAGEAEDVCPRGLLRRVLKRADGLGYAAKAGVEYEFFVFDETPRSIREKGYRDLKTLTPGAFGYSVLRSSVHAELYQELLAACEAMRMPLEGLHTETGAGVLEAALQAEDALEAADQAALFKTVTKVVAQRRGLMACFMAKWSNDWPGCSGHIHLSLTDKAGVPVFHSRTAKNAMSDVMRWFIGGQQALMPELLCMTACTVNSFTRLVPGFWAPTAATWGVENRTCALRVIGGGARSQRVEFRIAAADINPYIAMAAALGSGLWGIENKIEPTAPVVGNAYEQAPPEGLSFPATLTEAAHRLLDSDIASELFGRAFVEHYASTRIWEEREFRRAVTNWELDRYFEII